VQFFQGRQREIIRAKEQDLLRQCRGGIQSLSGLENTQHICSCSKKSPVAQTTAAMLNLSFGSFVSLVGLLSNVTFVGARSRLLAPKIDTEKYY